MGNGNNHISMPFHTFGSAPDRKILARPALRPDVNWVMNNLLLLETRYALNLLLRLQSKIENLQEAHGLFEGFVVDRLSHFQRHVAKTQ